MCHLWILIFIPHDFESSGQWSAMSTVAAVAASNNAPTTTTYRKSLSCKFIYLFAVHFFPPKKGNHREQKCDGNLHCAIVPRNFGGGFTSNLRLSSNNTFLSPSSFWDRIVLYLCDDYLFIPRRRRRRHWTAEYLRRHRLILTFSFNTI